MDVVADLPTDAQSPEPMQQGKRLLDDPAVLAQPGAVFGAAPGDDRRDTHRPNLLAILVVVVGTVGIHRVRPSSRAPAATAYWRDVLDQRHELGDVVAVAAGQRRLQRDAVRFGDQVMFRASSGTVDRARSGLGRPSWPAGVSRRSPPATSPARPPRAARPAGSRAAVSRLRRCSSPAAAASRSCPSRTRVLEAATPTECRCRGRTGCRTALSGRPGACAQGDRHVEAGPVATAGYVPTARRRRSTAVADPSSRP